MIFLLSHDLALIGNGKLIIISPFFSRCLSAHRNTSFGLSHISNTLKRVTMSYLFFVFP